MGEDNGWDEKKEKRNVLRVHSVSYTPTHPFGGSKLQKKVSGPPPRAERLQYR